MLFRDAVEDWNSAAEQSGRRFEFKIESEYDAAVQSLERYRFDGALLDLRLPSPKGGDTVEPLGNALAKKVLRENGIPAAIITALQAELDSEIANSPTVTRSPKISIRIALRQRRIMPSSEFATLAEELRLIRVPLEKYEVPNDTKLDAPLAFMPLQARAGDNACF